MMLSTALLILTTWLLAPVDTAAASKNLIWSCTGGGWRAMVAQSAYAQVFSKLGILGRTDDDSIAHSNSDDGANDDGTATAVAIRSSSTCDKNGSQSKIP